VRLVILDPCRERWAAMPGDELTRRCAVCNKPVSSARKMAGLGLDPEHVL